MAKLSCNLCTEPLHPHCPATNPVCVWYICRTTGCSAHIYDIHRGLLRHTDGHVEGWDDQPGSDRPPVVEIVGEQGPEVAPPPLD